MRLHSASHLGFLRHPEVPIHPKSAGGACTLRFGVAKRSAKNKIHIEFEKRTLLCYKAEKMLRKKGGLSVGSPPPQLDR